MKKILIPSLLILTSSLYAQTDRFPTDPGEAVFVTSDIANFWTAFDSVGLSSGNPFDRYIRLGSKGLTGFIPHRIKSADSLLVMVKQRKTDYELRRDIESKIKLKEIEVKPYFYKLKELYPKAVFPPVYFVFGRYNSGGTASKDGLIIGAEMSTDLTGLKGLVIHESIHFQQTFPAGETTLLQQSILEGTADFISGLVTGGPVNATLENYGILHRQRLHTEFVERMNKTDMSDWLYGTTKKDDRPNDMGYWMGYKIVEAYYNKAEDKKAAIDEILNIKDYEAFTRKSGYLQEFLERQGK